MGTYIYRVTKETVRCSDGELANIAIYAFKPWWDSKLDSKLAFSTGCVASDRMAAAGRISKRVVIGVKDDVSGKIVATGSAVFHNTHNLGTLYDDTLGMPNQFPKVEGVTI